MGPLGEGRGRGGGGGQEEEGEEGIKRGREIRRREVRPLGEVEGGGEGRGRG